MRLRLVLVVLLAAVVSLEAQRIPGVGRFVVPAAEAPPEQSDTLCADAGVNVRYMDSAAGGTGTGASWANAWTTLSEAESEVSRGQTVCVADGSYGGATLNVATSSTTTITLAKATASDHGSETGWSSGMGDGQAVFGDIQVDSSYWVIDGAVRDEDDWGDETAYGFAPQSVHAGGETACADNVTVRYAKIESGDIQTGRPVFLRDFLGGSCDNWTFSRNLLTNSSEVNLAGSGLDNILFEYNLWFETYGKESIRAQTNTTNVTIRYNVFHDTCRIAPGGEGCTAVIGFFGNPGPDDYSGFRMYGNVFWRSISESVADAMVFVQTDDCVMSQNTVYMAATSGTAGLLCGVDASGGGAVQNNITYVPNGASAGFQGSTVNNNSTYTSSPPFVNVSTGDFHLTGAVAGTALGSPYDEDLDGCARTTPDRGAFEFPAC